MQAIDPDTGKPYVAGRHSDYADRSSDSDDFERPKVKAYHGEAFYIQVGAFSSRQTAESTCKRAHLASHASTRITPLYGHGVRLYRVQVGPLFSLKKADEVTAKLKQAGFHHPMAVRD